MVTLEQLKKERDQCDEEIAFLNRTIAEMPHSCGVRLNLKIQRVRLSGERMQIHHKICKIENEEKLRKIYGEIAGFRGPRQRAVLPQPHVYKPGPQITFID